MGIITIIGGIALLIAGPMFLLALCFKGFDFFKSILEDKANKRGED